MILLNALTWAVVAYGVAALNIVFGMWLKTIVLTTVAFTFVIVMQRQPRTLGYSCAVLVAIGAGFASRNMAW